MNMCEDLEKTVEGFVQYIIPLYVTHGFTMLQLAQNVFRQNADYRIGLYDSVHFLWMNRILK